MTASDQPTLPLPSSSTGTGGSTTEPTGP
jgi:hypothetical protein